MKTKISGMLAILMLCGTAASANTNFTWHFTNTAYDVSDPALIEVDTNGTGNAQLILQAAEIYKNSINDYLSGSQASMSPYLSMGPFSLFRLTGSNSYSSAGTFVSRIMDPGQNVLWDSFIFKGSDADFIPDQSLKALYRMDGDGWLDYVSGGYGMATNNPSFTAEAKWGNAGMFRGNAYGDSVTLIGNRLLNNEMAYTIACWIKLKSFAHIAGLVVTRGSGNNGNFFSQGSWAPGNYAKGLWAGPFDGSTATLAMADNIVESNVWFFAVNTWDALGDGRARLYVNGGLVATSSGTKLTPFFQDDNLRLANDDYGGRFSDCIIDEVAIFTRALSASEVTNLYISYARTYPLKFQVRSGSSGADIVAKQFVGPDTTSNTFYTVSGDTLVDCTDFSISNRLVQYRAQLSASTNSLRTPHVESVVFMDKNSAYVIDDMDLDFAAGQFSSVTNYPVGAEKPCLALTRNANGGFPTNGAYTSRVLDAGGAAFWNSITWDAGSELYAGMPGLLGLWRMNGGVGGAPPGAAGTNFNVTFTDLAKIGGRSAVFDEDVQSHVVFPVNTNAQTVELWLNVESLNGGVMEIARPGTNSYELVVTNRSLVLKGLPASEYTLYMNGEYGHTRLLSGWNHIALAFNQPVYAGAIDLGTAGGNFLTGMADELAVYNRQLGSGELKGHFLAGRRQVAGTVRAEVRYGDALPLTNSFAGNYANGDSLTVPGNPQYLQYRLKFMGDGNVTPAISSATVTYNLTSTFVDDTHAEFIQGTNEAGSTAWYGDEIRLNELAAFGPLNMSPFLVDAQALWHMDEASWTNGGPVVEDSRGSYEGTPNGDANTSSGAKAGKRCGNFDGNGDYVDLNAIALAGDFTVMFWFNSSWTGKAAVVSCEDAADWFTVWLNSDGTSLTNGKVSFVVNAGGLTRTATASRDGLNDNRWHHVAVQRSAGQIHLYIDGERQASASAPSGVIDGNSLHAGKRGSSFDSYYAGRLDELAIWSRALSEGEIGAQFSGAYRSGVTGAYTGCILDAGQPAIWQTLSWTTDGPYGKRLSPSADTSLLALWSMEDTAGGVATNSVTGVGSGLNGSPVSNATGRIGSCLDFDAGDYITVNDATLDINTLSVEAWVYMDAVTSQTILDKSDGANNGYAIRTDASGVPVFKVDVFPCSGYLPIRLQKWTHLCGTYANDVIKLYVDGELAGQVTNAFGATPASGQPAYIAGRGVGLYDGRMDEVAVHSRVLNPEEVFDHYKAGAVTLKFQCRVADTTNAIASATFYGPGKNASTYFTEAKGDDMVSDLDLGQFFQFRAYLATEDYKLSPKLSGVKVYVANYPSSNPWVQPMTTNGFPFLGELISASHIASNRVGTSAGYQIARDNSTWWYWNGSQWATASSSAETNPVSVITANLGSFYDQVCPKTGGVFRFRSFLHSAGDQQMWLDAFTIQASEGRIVVTAPNGTETGEYAWASSVPYPVTWSSTGTVGAASLVVDLYNELGNTQLVNLATNVINNGATNVVLSGTPGRYRVRVWDAADTTIGDYSDSFFELVENFYLVAPNGGEYWRIGNTQQIRWDVPAAGVSPVVDFWITYDGDNWMSNNAAWTRVAQAVTNVMGNRNSYNWLIPSNNWRLVSEKARMAVVPNGISHPLLGYPGGAKRDFSNRNFTNAGIVVTYPALNQGVRSGNFEPITWTAAGVGTQAVVELYNGISWVMLGTNSCAPITNNVMSAQLIGRTTSARIRATSGGITGISELFTLADVNISSPTGGSEAVRSHWLIDSTNDILWTSSGASNRVNVKYTTDELGGVWIMIGTNLVNDDTGAVTNKLTWVVPGPPSGTVTVRVESASQPSLYADVGPFSMAGVELTRPVGAVVWDFTATNEIDWLSRDGASIVDITVSYDAGANFESITNPPAYSQNGTNFTFVEFGSFRRPSDQTRLRLTQAHQTIPTLNFVDVSAQNFGLRGVAMRYPSNPVVMNLNRTATNGIQWYSALTLESQAQFYYLADGPLSTTSNVIWREDGLTTFFSNTDSGSCSNQANWAIDRSFKPSVNAVIKATVGTAYSALTQPFTMRGVRILYPARGDQINIGDTVTVSWDYAAVMGASRASNFVSLAGMTGTFVTNGFATDSQIDFGGVSYTVDPDSDPTTNAIIKVAIYNPVGESDVVAYSQPFTMRGIKFTQPTAGTNWMIGQTVNIQFMAAGMGAGAQAAVYYSPDGVTFDTVKPVTNNYTILDGINTLPWTIENSSALTRMPSTNAHLMIVSGSSTNITRAFTLNGIKILVPRFGDVWAVSDGTNDIIWASVGMAGVNNLSFTVDSGTNIMLLYPHTQSIAAGVAGTNFAWPLSMNSVGKPVRIGLTNGSYVTYSEAFEMVEQPSVRIKSPAAGDYWKVTETNAIEWIRGGDMSNSFRVLVTYRDGTTEQLGADGAFPISLGVFSYSWGPIPDRLGVARLVVTNLVNPAVYDVFTNFTIAPKFKVNPAFTEQPYALKPLTFFFDTFGSVTNGVDFYYTTDPMRSSNSWVHVNPGAPMTVANNANLPYTWTVADARSSVAYLRIQDHSYTQRFSIARPGPFNDYGPFDIRYYQVVWYVLDSVTTQNLDHLSVVESLGSVTDVSSPWTNYYPYGTWDSVWYRENFSDKAVLAWKPQLSSSNLVMMARSTMEPDYHVLSDFAYDGSNFIFHVHSWLERSGAILTDPADCTLKIFNSTGTKLYETTTSTHDLNGVFWQSWNIFGLGYTAADLFFAKVEIKFAGATYSAGLTFTLRMSAEAEQLSLMQGMLDVATSNILVGVDAVGSNVTGVASNLTAFRTEASGTLSNIQANVIASRTDIANLSTNLGSLTNGFASGIDGLSSNIAMLTPLFTNLMSVTETMSSNTVSSLARILTRPTTMQYGSTNSILYKTQRGFGGGVAVTVSNASQGTVHSGMMAEIVGGIYQYDLVANWGTNSYMISCVDPGPAMDSMIVDVVGEVSSAVPGLLVGLSNQMATVEGQISNLTSTVSTLTSLTNMTSSLSNSLASLEFALTNSVLQDLSNLSNTLAGVDWNDIRAISNGVAAISNSISGVNWSELAGLTNLTVLTNTLAGMNWSDITALDTQVRQIYTAVSGLGSADLSQVESGLSSMRTVLDTILTAGVFQTDMTALTRLEQEVGSIEDTAESQTFFGRLTALEQQISRTQGSASDASKKAQSAKGEASKAATGINVLKTSLAKGNMEGAQSKLDEIMAALGNARSDINGLGPVKKLGTLYEELDTMSKTIEELAGREGYGQWLRGKDAVKGGKPEGEEDLKTLIKNHEEVKTTLVFIQKLLDEHDNKPVVEAELMGE